MKPVPAYTTTSDRLTTVLSYGALLLLGYLVFLIFAPFLVPLAWSAVLAIFFYPLHENLTRRMPATGAALLSTLGVTLLLIAPTLIVLFYATRQALDATARIQTSFLHPDEALPAHLVEWFRSQLPVAWQSIDFSEPLRQGAEKVAGFLAGKFAGLVKNLLSFFVDLFIVIFALFFMFRDGEDVVRAVRHLFPFDESIQEDMVGESKELIFASVAVGLVVALIQGVLGGTAFALAGIPTPIFWGVVIAFFSLVPVVGSAMIWIPAALWMGFSGHWGKAFEVVAICGGVAGIADNIVRPLLLRNRTHLNDLLLFIGVLGGLQVFGLLGLVVGPTLVAAAMAVFRVYMEHREKLAEARA
ncbi:MAG TPA: AI-2E family transporter [Candidatus Dormibacteraeota bacterium]|nr:AI-2E family transporter [Candidatus Dormibacteraeota bacterium]